MSDAKYFQRGKIQEFRSELNSEKKDPKHQRKKTVMKKIVANMTMGNDMSSLYSDVVACMQVNVLEIKKMVYLYLINYSRVKPDQTRAAIAYFLRDANDHDPLIRALAIRTMSYIQVKDVIDASIDPIRKSLKDPDPYVRKTAATCVAKLYSCDRQRVDDEGFISMLKDLLLDANPTVVCNAVAALAEISERSPELTLQLNLRIASKLIAALNECNEWGQAYILETLLYVVPQEPGDAEMLCERIAPRLQHANASVVLNAIKVIMYLMNYMAKEEDVRNFCKKLSPPLVTLLSSGPEVQYVALRNILLVIQKHPGILKDEIKVFFCKYNDPIYVKLAKLEIIFRLATADNVGQVLNELVEYASEVDVDFVRKSVRAIGRLAIKIPTSTQRCISALLDLIQTKVNYVVQEGIVVIKDIFRKYPNKYESIIGKLCENLDSLDEPEAKASMIWIIGQYADRISNSDEILEGFMDSFLEDPPEVQLSLLTAVVKLFIKRPTVGQELVPKILKWATEEADNPDLRDRGYIYWRMLSADPAAAKAIVLSERPEISTETENIEIGLLDELLLHISSLASVYHKVPSSFIPNTKPRYLVDSKVLHGITLSQFESQKADNEVKKTPVDKVSEPAFDTGFFDNAYTNEVAPVNEEKFVNLLDLDNGDFSSAMGQVTSTTDFGNGEMAESNIAYESNLLSHGQPGSVNSTNQYYNSFRQQSQNGGYPTASSLFTTGSSNMGSFGAPRTDSPFTTNNTGDYFQTASSMYQSTNSNSGTMFNTAQNSTGPSIFDTAQSNSGPNIFDTASGMNGGQPLASPVFGGNAFSNMSNNSVGINSSNASGNLLQDLNQISNSPNLFNTEQDTLSDSFNQLSMNEGYVPAKTLLIDPSTNNGVEIHATFARISGRKQMAVQFVNRSNQALNNFAIQFNTNTFGLTPSTPLEVPALSSNQTHTSILDLTINNPTTTQPITQLQIAFNTNLGVNYGQATLPLHILFSENGCLEQRDYLTQWRNISSDQEVKLSIDQIKMNGDVEFIRNKLNKNNVFTVADRNINGKVYMFISLKLDDNTLFLIELTYESTNPSIHYLAIKLIPNTNPQNLDQNQLIHAVHQAISDILHS